MRIKIHWLFLPVGAACSAALYFLQKRRKSGDALPSDQAVPAEPAVPKASLEASYSFISGFQDAATVDMQFSYDSERFRYTVAEEDFLAERPFPCSLNTAPTTPARTLPVFGPNSLPSTVISAMFPMAASPG